jgi:hypothetical protein
LALDPLVELTKDNYAPSTRFNAATVLLDRGYGRPAQSLDLHLSADAITKRLSDMSDAELATLEQRMIAAAPIVLEATAEVSDDAGELPGRRRRGFPAGWPLLDSALTQNLSSASPSVSDSPAVFDVPRTFPESNASHATIWLISATHP